MNTQTSQESMCPPPAPLSIGIVAIPADPLYTQVSRASLAITERTKNDNIIDNAKFPCHLSLMLLGTNDAGITRISTELAHHTGEILLSTATKIYSTPRGFIGVEIDSLPLAPLREQVLALMRDILYEHQFIRPHLVKRWPRLTTTERDQLLRFGTYKVDNNFVSHLSVALVAPDVVGDMTVLAQEFVPLPQEASFVELQLVDVGHFNERWNVLDRVPLGSAQDETCHFT